MIVLTGASGLLGQAITARLTEQGLPWKALRHGVDWTREEGLRVPQDAGVWIHLAGAPIAAARWTETRKQEIADSRILGTEALARSFAAQSQPPDLVLCASATGFFGARGEEVLREGALPGEGFLPDLVQAWEAASAPLKEAGIRVITLRLGIVLSRQGGALAKMLPAFRLGLGGPIGNGQGWMSWIHLDDAARFFVQALSESSWSGTYHLVAPKPARNRDFTRSLAAALHRPAFLPLPAPLIRLLFGEMGEALFLASTRVLPERILQETDFEFLYPTLNEALQQECGTYKQSVDKPGSPCE